MPCRDYGSDDSLGRSYDLELHAMKHRLDKLARIACKAMNELKSSYATGYNKVMEDREVKEWYEQHLKDDLKAQKAAERKKEKEKKQQMLLKNALAKLTKEEIAAFGLKG